jgi:hypothetical protein
MSGHRHNGQSSRRRGGPPSRSQGHRLGGDRLDRSRGHAAAHISQTPGQPFRLVLIDNDGNDLHDLGGSHGRNDPMHHFANAMASLDNRFGGHAHNDPMHRLANAMASLESRFNGRGHSHGGSMRADFGPGFPFDSDIGGDESLEGIMDNRRLHLGDYEAAFSHPIFNEHRPSSRSGRSFRDFFPFGPLAGSHIHDEDFGLSEDLPFHTHPMRPGDSLHSHGASPFGMFPVEFEHQPLHEDMGPTQSSEERVNNFILRHTEPLTAANTTSTRNTDCPICMENTTVHFCVKIKGIAGCEHMIGRDCLKELLKRQPDDEKPCPLCRAVWLPENGVWQNSEQWGRRTGRAN